MRNIRVLELLNNGRIEELKRELEDEIYTESLKTKPNAKRRYSAMKKYFTYVTSVREALSRPAVIQFEGEEMTSFTNSYSLVLTRESCGEIKLHDSSKHGNYPDVERLIRYDGVERKINFQKIFAEAKSRGYKLKKSEVAYADGYLLSYGSSYFRLGLIDASYGIIDDGEDAVVYHVEGSGRPMTIKTSLGVCLIMPTRMEEAPQDSKVIEVK